MSTEALSLNPRRASPVWAGLSKLWRSKTELALCQALISINVLEQKANAVIEALESDMRSLLATKTDIAALEVKLSQLEIKLTLRMGLMLSIAVGVLIAAMKFLH